MSTKKYNLYANNKKSRKIQDAGEQNVAHVLTRKSLFLQLFPLR